MKRMLACLALTLLVGSVAAAEKPKIAVLDLGVDTGLDAGTVKTLNEVVLDAFHQSGRYEVFGSADIATMITLEEERVKITGCADNSCLVEIGGALGVQLVAAARVGKLGDKFVISAKIVNVAEAKVLSRATESVPADEGQLLDVIHKIVKRVLGDLDGAPAEPVAVETAPDAKLTEQAGPDKPVTFMDVAPWITLGLTVAAGGVAAALGGLALKDAEAARSEVEGTPEWKDARDSTDSRALGADVMIGVAAAAAVGTVVLFVLGSLDDETEPKATAGVAPLRGGAAATLSLRFE